MEGIMNMNSIRTQYARLTICAVLVALFVAALPAGAALADEAAKGRPAVSDEGARIALPKDKVIVEAKTLEAVITNVRDRYAVTQETIITGLTDSRWTSGKCWSLARPRSPTKTSRGCAPPNASKWSAWAATPAGTGYRTSPSRRGMTRTTRSF